MTINLAETTASIAAVPTHEEAQLRETVAKIATDFGRARYLEATRNHEMPKELWEPLGANGYLGVNLPEEYGGGGLGLWALAAVGEELAAAGCPIPQFAITQAIIANILVKHGTTEQKDEWLPKIATGEITFSFAITEPDAGSNSHKISTVARRDGGKFILRGTKTFISGIEDAAGVLVVVQTQKDEATGRGKLSLLLVDPDAPGLERQQVETGLEAPEKQWMLFFDDVEVDASQLVGEENKGLRAVFDGLNPERIMGAATGLGIGRYAIARATAYANERAVWDVPIGSHQGVAHPLAEAYIELELARLMTQKAAVLYDAGLDAAEASNIAKFAAADAGTRCLDQAIQVHGGNGVANEYGLIQLWWLMRSMRIIPVSREMVLNHIAEHSLGLPKSY